MGEPFPPLRRGEIFNATSTPASGEVFEPLVAGREFRLERIVSTGQATPPGEWYDQETDEWVALLSGYATLCFEHATEPVELVPGAWVLIPAGCRHRVERTAAGEATVWLALHFRPE